MKRTIFFALLLICLSVRAQKLTTNLATPVLSITEADDYWYDNPAVGQDAKNRQERAKHPDSGDGHGGNYLTVSFPQHPAKPIEFEVRISFMIEKDPFHPKYPTDKKPTNINWNDLKPLSFRVTRDGRIFYGFKEDESDIETTTQLIRRCYSWRSFEMFLPWELFHLYQLFDTPEKKAMDGFRVAIYIKADVYHHARLIGRNTKVPIGYYVNEVEEQGGYERKYEDLGTDDLSSFFDEEPSTPTKEEEVECYPIAQIAQSLLWSNYAKDGHHSYEGDLGKYGIGEMGMGQVGIYTSGGYKYFKDGCYLWTSVHRGRNDMVSKVTFSHMDERDQHHLCNLQNDLARLKYRKVRTEGRTVYYETPTVNNLYQIAILEYDQNSNLTRAMFEIMEKLPKKEITISIPPHKHHYLRKIEFEEPKPVDVEVPAKYPETVEIKYNDTLFVFKKADSNVSDNIYMCQDMQKQFKSEEELREFFNEIQDSLDMEGRKLSFRLPMKKEVYKNTKGQVTEKDAKSEDIYFSPKYPIIAMDYYESSEGPTLVRTCYIMNSKRTSRCKECGDTITTKWRYRFSTLKQCIWFKNMWEKYNEF